LGIYRLLLHLRFRASLIKNESTLSLRKILIFKPTEFASSHKKHRSFVLDYSLSTKRSLNGGCMWAGQELIPFLEISHWLTYGLYAAAVLFGAASIASLRK
jgi:tRNA(Glu) U13 pseudouridine synthase TruD